MTRMGLKWPEQRKYLALAANFAHYSHFARGLNWSQLAPFANSTPATLDQLVKMLRKQGTGGSVAVRVILIVRPPPRLTSF